MTVNATATKIGVGITTRNRPDVLKYCLKHHGIHTESKIVIVNDGGDKIGVGEHDIPHSGISAAKNKCLELLDDCDHVFLLDDDIYPVRKWEQQYIEAHRSSGKEILMWMTPRNGFIKENNGVDEYKRIQGVLFSITRKALDKIGGWNTSFKYGWADYAWIDRAKSLGIIDGYWTIKKAEKYLKSLDVCMPRPISIRGVLEYEDKKREMTNNKGLYETDSKKPYFWDYKLNRSESDTIKS